MPFTIGENVGAYRIVEKLGQGGMATVYKAYHAALDRYVAIKVMHPAFMEDPNFLARFQREARIVARLDHPNIIPIYDFAEHKEHPYLVMRFVEGETLKARLQQGPIEEREAQHIVRAVGEALTYAHNQGVLHRDIKPSNILLTPDSNRSSGSGIYLTDFGLARMAEAGESTLSRDMMVGTPQYISPEQAKGVRELDARTDVYSLGVVLYEMLVGRVPFTADTPYAIIHDHIFTPLPMPRELNPDLPEPLERVLLKALAKSPDDRFQSVAEMVSALDDALGVEPIPTPIPGVAAPVLPPPAPTPEEAAVRQVLAPPPPAAAEQPKTKEPRKKKRRWVWIAAGLGGMLLLVTIVFLALILFDGTDRDPADLLEEARMSWEEGDLEYAIELYTEILEKDPYMTPAYLESSEVLIEMDQVDEAIRTLQKGIDLNPHDPDLHRYLAGDTILLERWEIAEKEVRWFTQEVPEEPITHAYVATLRLSQGEPCDQVRPQLDQALRPAPDLSWAHYGLALCHLQAEDREPARAELERVLQSYDVTTLLAYRAIGMLETLNTPPEITLERQVEVVIQIVGEIPDQDLVRDLREKLSEARQAWEEGDRQTAVDMLQEAISTVRENRATIGALRARRLEVSLKRLVEMASRP